MTAAQDQIRDASKAVGGLSRSRTHTKINYEIIYGDRTAPLFLFTRNHSAQARAMWLSSARSQNISIKVYLDLELGPRAFFRVPQL